MKSEFEGQIDRVSRMAGDFVLAGDNNTAMGVVRSIGDIANRAQAMSSVAYSIGTKGNIDAAVPLFSLAFQSTNRIGSGQRRFEVIRDLVYRQSKLGRSADAFKMAGFVRDRLQALTMLAMGKAMLEVDDLKNVETVTNYIPYIGMRSQIFTALANVKGIAGKNMEASALLAKGLADLPNAAAKKINPESLERAPYAKCRNSTPRWRAGSSSLAVRSHTSIIEKSADHEAARRGSIEDGGDLGEKWQKTNGARRPRCSGDWRGRTPNIRILPRWSNITNAQLAAGLFFRLLIRPHVFRKSRQATDNRAAFIDASSPLESPLKPRPCAQSPWQPVQSGDQNFRSAPCAPLRTKRRAHTPSPASQPPSRRRSSANTFYPELFARLFEEFIHFLPDKVFAYVDPIAL